ncbi:MAG: sigma-54-dependent Fis family transcriptional regulator [Phycisphaerales bacterium]|nr:sigma-54-dependent Fis family transcriptional regulator [Phycisphaerales bacterium]
MARICVVDDKAMLRDSLAETLRREDHVVETFDDPQAALPEILTGRFDLALTDLKMPNMTGVELLREVRNGGCDVPVIVMTAYGTVDTAVEALKYGAFDYMQKPFDANVIVVQVERALRHGQIAKENEVLRASLADRQPRRELVGDSDAMVQLRVKIAQIARSNGTVLIAGESGTGKELVASAVHEASRRADQPMLCLNCAALSENLLESELFGHERGAFTGADRTRKGRFELADGGTLLLDEISEMALPLQAKLLRVLQEGEFERVGSSTTRWADVRVIATTNRDLPDWVAQKRFREDLYYRLNVLPVQLTPLRERREDIPLLARHFMTQIAKVEGRKPPVFTTEALRLLQGYNWPGNVRELENLCQRAAALLTGDKVLPKLIEDWLRGATPQMEFGEPLRHGRMLEDMERRLIERTLAQFGGHREKSAKALGMGVRTLGMKLKQWREERERESELKAQREMVGAR